MVDDFVLSKFCGGNNESTKMAIYDTHFGLVLVYQLELIEWETPICETFDPLSQNKILYFKGENAVDVLAYPVVSRSFILLLSWSCGISASANE